MVIGVMHGGLLNMKPPFDPVIGQRLGLGKTSFGNAVQTSHSFVPSFLYHSLLDGHGEALQSAYITIILYFSFLIFIAVKPSL